MKSVFRQMRAIALGWVGLLAASGQAQAQIADWVARIDEDRLAAGEIHLGLHMNGERDGFMRLGWHLVDGTLLFYDRSMLASAEVYETMEGRLDATDFAAEAVRIRFHQQATIYHFDVEFDDNEVRGEMARITPGQPTASQPIHADLPEAIIARAGFFLLSALAPLEVGQSISFDWYAPMSLAVESITVTAAAHQIVDTPAGSFETIRLEQRGGTPANDVFVDVETGRIVRIDIDGMPMQFLALPAPE